MKTMFIPATVALLGLIAVFHPLAAVADSVVATHVVRAGTVLTAADVAIAPETIPGAADHIDDVIGMEARRNLYADRAIRLADLGPPTLVKRNSRVTMIYRTPGLTLRTEGRALDSGGIGEMVRVMNLSSRTNVFAMVQATDTVEVSP